MRTLQASTRDASHSDRRGGSHAAVQDPVSVLFSRHIKKDRETEYEEWARAVTAAARNFPGYLSASAMNVPGSREYHLLYTFADRASLDAWLDSEERARWMVEVDALTEAERGLQKVTGLETWFTLSGTKIHTMKPPSRWKMWLVTVTAIYPLILVLFWLLAPRIAHLPLGLRALIFPLVLVTLMTYAVMPAMTRMLRRWLEPRTEQR
jgi:antibiotic biosynthesis monooxygenase (ABM) superfamily enzyme